MLQVTTNRQELIELLKAYVPHDLQNKDSYERTLLFLNENPSVFGDENSMGHVTASAWILNASRDNALLTHHRKLNKWLQLGGHTEPHEFIRASALREAIEESGLLDLTLMNSSIFDVDVHEIPVRGERMCHLHYDIRFIFLASDTASIQISEESIDLKWVPLQDIVNYTQDQSVLRMVDKTMQILRDSQYL